MQQVRRVAMPWTVPRRQPRPDPGLSQTEVVKAGLDLLQQHSTSPAALAEGLGLIGSFSSAAQEGGTTNRGRDHSALLRQKLSRQQSQQRLSRPQP
jgi:hypothetical protein